MNINTLSEISQLHRKLRLRQIELKTLFELESPRWLWVNPLPVTEPPNLERLVWESIEASLKELSPSKASFVKDLGEHGKDPVRILTMALLNLSSKEVSEFRVALGIPELTPQS